MPRPETRKMSVTDLLRQLKRIGADQERSDRVLRIETVFREKIEAHLAALPAKDANFKKFNTNPYVLLMHARQKSYTKISELESDILPAKQFSSMETSAGRMVEEVVLPEYGWTCVNSEMHTANSILDGRKYEADLYRLVTLKSGPRCLNDATSKSLADAIVDHFGVWANESDLQQVDFTYGVLYGTRKQSLKKDWHILNNIRKRMGESITVSPDNKWTCQFQKDGITVDVTIRIGLDWWEHLGGEFCFIEVFTALIRACIDPSTADPAGHEYTIKDLSKIVQHSGVSKNFNSALLQQSQIPWLLLMARHFCDEFE